MSIKNILLMLLITVALLSSCASKKKIVYLQDAQNVGGKSNVTFETVIQPDDLLLIYVSAKDRESAEPFNMEILMVQNSNGQSGQRQQQLYLVDNQGYIDFPVLGKLKISGMTKFEVIKMFKEKLSEYVQDPIINLRIINFKVSVFGEVAKSGTFSVSGERISLLEAITMAGDMTIYGNRKNILIVREVDGVKKTARVDLTQSSFVNSEYYYLKQNDLVYVQPNKTKVNASVVGPNISVGLSIVSLIVTVIALSTRF